MTHILGRQLQRCISRQFLCRGHPEMVVQYILDPPRIGRTLGVRVVNHRQLEMSGVLSVAVLGTLPEIAFSPP